MALRFWTDFGDYRTRPLLERNPSHALFTRESEEEMRVAMNFRWIYLRRWAEMLRLGYKREGEISVWQRNNAAQNMASQVHMS